MIGAVFILVIFLAVSCGRVVAHIGGSLTTTSQPQNDCFKRISTGERLIGYDVTRIVDRSTIDTCQQECLIYKCTHFSFGGGFKGNGTCELTTDRQVSRRHDPGFDLYERTHECIQGKPKGYEQACYRRIYSGRRLNERFIRHSLPCNSLEACQHQCSIEKHFDCQGFNIRLDPAKVGRGICELSSVASKYLDEGKDFSFDPEFLYYERVYDYGSPNCGSPNGNGYPSDFPRHDRGGSSVQVGPKDIAVGSLYRGGDSYGLWSTGGDGTSSRGSWVSYGYGSGHYIPADHPREAMPWFRDAAHHRPYNPGNGGDGHQGQRGNHLRPNTPQWFPTDPQRRYPISGAREYDRRNRIPTYIIIDANANHRRYGDGYGHGVSPDVKYLPSKGPQRTESQEPGREDVPRVVTLPPMRPTQLPSSPPLPFPPAEPSVRSNVPPTTPPHEDPPRPPKNNRDPQQDELTFSPRDAALRPHVYPARPEDLPPARRFPSKDPHFPPPGRHVPQFSGHEVCFQRAHPGYRLNVDSIRQTYDAPTILDCEAMCAESSFKCTGYSFRYSSSGGEMPNCLLTDFQTIVRTSNLLPDRSCDVYFKMNTCLHIDRTEDTECFLKVSSSRRIEPGKVAKILLVGSISQCELACLSSSAFTCRSFAFRSGPAVIGEPGENCLLSDWPVSALSLRDLVFSPGHEVYERGSYGHGCELDVGPEAIGPGPPFDGYPLAVPGRDSWAADETWRHYTVSGWPCKMGTQCQLNPIGGFWACEVEGGDREQWDYCCSPRHSCGYSRGYNYPWCYVGEVGSEQWRPCSEHYYPEFGNRFQSKPAHMHNSHPDDSYGPPRDERPWNFGSSVEFGPPEHWPISYLYAEPPPNETYVWDEDFHHYHHDHRDHDSIEHGGHRDEGQTIRFKSCARRLPYPKAFVQKLDLSNETKTSDPEEQMLADKNKEEQKNVGYRHAISAPDDALGFSPANGVGERENPKKEEAEHPNDEKEAAAAAAIAPVFAGKSDGRQHAKSKKAKQVIKAINEIIEQSSKGVNEKPKKKEDV